MGGRPHRSSPPDRQPLPRPDVRRMLVPLGPVAVFGASNFPLAFSVAGGDTVSALAAGCPVVVKAHPAHPGTSELVARAILAAAGEAEMPDGVFSMVHGPSPEVGQALVTSPAIQAVGFTGSFRGGKALFDAAARRAPNRSRSSRRWAPPTRSSSCPARWPPAARRSPRRWPPPSRSGAASSARAPASSSSRREPAARPSSKSWAGCSERAPAGTMVHAGIKSAYDTDLEEVSSLPGVTVAARSAARGAHPATEAQPALLVVDLSAWRGQSRLGEELYGPATVAVRCPSPEALLEAARALGGHLTATAHATEDDLAAFPELLGVLCGKAGRVLVGGVPTGVEVSPAMHHGGPWPATTDPRATSVGTAAIERFARPVCLQNVPDSVLPEELRDANPRGLWRLVDGQPTREPL